VVEVEGCRGRRGEENGSEDLVGNVVCLDDAACAPDLPDLRVINGPFVSFVGLRDDVKTLDEAG
jgi:hypothetical protein